jgi:anti-sigma factor RsiW
VSLVNCKKAIKELSGYLDGELDAALKQTLEAHLTYCNHCHAVYDSAKKTIELYCDGKLFALPEDVRTRLHEALKRRCQQKQG